jgi:DNA polymerase-1
MYKTTEMPVLPLPEYTYVNDKDHAQEILTTTLARHPVIEVDTEGTALDPYECRTTLMQLGIPGMSYVFDLRNDLPYSNIHASIFEEILTNKTQLKLLQNANYDMKVLKVQYGYYIENIYDTMLAEQLMYLGIQVSGFSLARLVEKYLGMDMDKEPRGTFQVYDQKFTDEQIGYAAKDVCILDMIRNAQMKRMCKYGLQEALQLEMDFIKPLAEMELNGIKLDIVKWRIMMKEFAEEAKELRDSIEVGLQETQDQMSLFGVSTINIDSPKQLKTALNRLGLSVESTSVEALSKLEGHPTVDSILQYRKNAKLVNTYGEALIDRIHPKTGRLHTEFKQMVSTGRMSSNKPNLQNIPGKQKFRSCFVAGEGKVLITVDQDSAELVIMGAMSGEPNFFEAYEKSLDLHTLNASRIYKVAYEEVIKAQRGASKAISFGLAYGISAMGLSKRLKITKKAAQVLIDTYFKVNNVLKNWLEKSAKEAVRNHYSTTITGRKRFYNIPPMSDPSRKMVVGSVERAAKNHRIQGCIVFDSNINGLGPIGNYVGKQVSLDTGYGKDTATCVYSGKKDVYTLELSNGASLGITLNHKIPVVSSEGVLEDVSVENLKLNEDFLMIPLKVIEGKATDLSSYICTNNKAIQYSYPDKMNSKLSFVIGALIGDGSYNYNNTINFICPYNQQELADKYRDNILDLFNYEVKQRITHTEDSSKEDLPVYSIYSVAIRDYFKYAGLKEVIHYEKSIPDYFFTETIENKGALLNGLFSTDGGMTESSGPSYTTVSRPLAEGIQNLLFSLGINSNLKTYTYKDARTVYRLQIHKRFNSKFEELIGFSVYKKAKVLASSTLTNRHADGSIVPSFIPKLIEKEFRKSSTYLSDFTYNEKAHLRRFKLGSCSFTSWRKYYHRLPEGRTKEFLSTFLGFDFCLATNLSYRGVEPTYDLMCENIHYFTANGVIVHNSDSDTIKKAMILCVERLAELNVGARLLLSVHDEIVVECPVEHVEMVAKVVTKAVDDGFNGYFHKMPMSTGAVIGPCWLKGECDHDDDDGVKCKHNEMEFVPDEHYGSKLVCCKCGKSQE